MNKKIGTIISSTLFLLTSSQVFATAYNMPSLNQSLIGKIQYSSASTGDSVVTIAKRYDLGKNAVTDANPHLNVAREFHTGSMLQIPTQHLLPNQAREGIVINLPEMRMYYYPIGTNQVLTYPIGIGKIGKTVPIVQTSIVRKTKNPIWIPTDNIREFNLQQGIVLPRVMPAGPDNPLGPYAIYMSIPTYLMHSTPFPESIGTRASFGCIRMYEADIEGFFPLVKKGIPVSIINSPVKVGWQNEHLFIEAHRPLEEHAGAYEASLPGMVHKISTLSDQQPTLIDWQLVSYISEERDGIPHEIGTVLPRNE